MNSPNRQIDGYQLKQFGQGSGLHGLPGDFTPPARFVRAAIFASTATPVANATQAVIQAFHILNQFDIPVGSVRAKEGNIVSTDATIATAVKDPQNLKFYFRTYEDQTIKMINLNTFDLNATTLKTLPMNGMQPVVDISMTAKEAVLAKSQ